MIVNHSSHGDARRNLAESWLLDTRWFAVRSVRAVVYLTRRHGDKSEIHGGDSSFVETLRN